MYFLLFLSICCLQNGLNGQQVVSGDLEELEKELKNNPIDPSSFSRSDHFRVTHIHWKAIVNFKDEIFDGSVDLSIEKLAETNKLTLDTSELTIKEVKDKETD